ncbi:MlaD family protein [Nocardia pseudobrasiliensis]|uniref:Phospholipid/cholesterol/gamma-HCH transport system substrate-binding protein n=1 Tax=Nocardia pseudobrasiliensis TaxID=45979 RepID=A0A370HSM7_9NOCA|nr:MlaD family protein [Nocardia pseudobrasiliensis]RDI61300.1 phospholipid/cholesterol/gamma-HCH transport system substrate-binding protein [Nocardia pseudobrasiliensis]
MRRSDLRWGIAVLAVAVTVLAGLGLVGVTSAGEDGYVAEFRNSGGLRPDDEVRVAGVRVGRVRTVDLSGDHVRIDFTVRSGTRVGDESSAEVRLLAPTGGHYLSVAPAGSKPLGHQPIPRERTGTPYELTDVLERATPPLEQADGATLRATMAELDRALADRPDTVRGLLGDLNNLVGVVAAQSDRVDRAVAVADEYVAATATDREVLADFVRRLGTISAELATGKTEVIRAFRLLRTLIEVTHRPIMAYADQVEPIVRELERLVATVGDAPQRLDAAIAGIDEFIRKVGPLVGVAVGGQRPCVPAPGREC